MKTRGNPRSLAFLALVLTTACADPTGSAGHREIGIVEWISGAQASSSLLSEAVSSEMAAVITAPEEVQAGVPFEVTITTIGPAICWRADGAETQVEGDLAEVVPYDFNPQSEFACGAAIIELPRTITITFAGPGDAIIRVNGRKVVGGDTSASTSTVVEKQILVR